ncbi:hypothetical protein V8167_000306 [Providencia rettgeri]|nr:hypothetical protein [Providencia rettgeri]
MIHFKKLNMWYLLFLIPFISVFIIEYNTPVHADDYNYFKMGNSVSNHLHHYLTWSGRLVSDYFSTLLLSTSSSLLKGMIIAFVFTTIIFLITKIAYIKEKNIKNTTFFLQFISIFLIFWITNPGKGQIVFWLVGAANYLVTNFFIVIFLYSLFNYLSNRKNLALLLIVSFFAGCSNENTCWIVLLLSISSSIYLYIKEKNKILFVSTALVFLGFATLIFSPGNFARAASSPEFANTTFIERVLHFLSESFPHGLGKTWIPILITLLLLIPYLKRNKSLDFYLSISLLLAGFLSMLSMVVAPSLPSRALSGAHLFFMLSMSFSIKNILTYRPKNGIIIFNSISLLALITFIYSFPETLYSYVTVNKQVNIRNYEVYKGLREGRLDITVPKFYFPKTLRAGDSINLFHNPANIAKYFGSKNPIDAHVMKYDFSIILTGNKYPINYIGIKNLYVGKDRFYSGSTIALEISPSIFKTDDNGYSLTIFSRDGKKEKIQSSEINNIYEMHIIGFTSKFRPNNILKITYDDSNGNLITLLSR